MPLSPAYHADPRYPRLGEDFGQTVTPAAFPRHLSRWRNARAAARIGLETLSDGEWEGHFARFEPLPANIPAPFAMAYHGHQFRHYNPDLGDGRGFLFAQVRDRSGRLLDLATKGSGRTPYSRGGDGRLTLKGGVREVLAAAMLEAQGVATSKALALFETGEALQRADEPSPTRASVLTRMSFSHIRFGMFERGAYLARPDMLTALVDHAVEIYFPALAGLEGQARAAAFLGAVTQESARLAGQWMAAGFVHGVLNTDNMTVTGESFDYGPWRFLPRSEPGFTAAYFDEQGLYCFARQPEAVSWNLAQLGSALTLIADPEALTAALAGFADAYRRGLREAMFARLGLKAGVLEDDLLLVRALFDWMTETGAPWAQFFHDWFAGAESAGRAARSPSGPLYAAPAFSPLRALIEARAPDRPQRLAHPVFARDTPVDLLIEDVEALWEPIAARDDWEAFEAKLRDIAALRDALDIAQP